LNEGKGTRGYDINHVRTGGGAYKKTATQLDPLEKKGTLSQNIFEGAIERGDQIAFSQREGRKKRTERGRKGGPGRR